jgi:signal transduction histidine kinase
LSFTRTVAEVELRNPHLNERSRKACEEIADEVSKASVLLDAMLTLARADDPSRSQVEGTRLGLAIAKWIAEIHHAEISVTSEERKGTTFKLAFPLCEVQDRPRTNGPYSR